MTLDQIPTITPRNIWVTDKGVVYDAGGTSALIVTKGRFGAKVKMTPLNDPSRGISFIDVKFEHSQSLWVQHQLEILKKSYPTVNPHENYVVTGSANLHSPEYIKPYLTLDNLQVFPRLYAVEETIVECRYVYIIADQKVSMIFDVSDGIGSMIDKHTYMKTNYTLPQLIEQLRNCAVSDEPVDLWLEKDGKRRLALPKMLGLHSYLASDLEEVIRKPNAEPTTRNTALNIQL